jgi:hypothetical protein
LNSSGLEIHKELGQKDAETVDDLEVSFDSIKKEVEMDDNVDYLEILLSSIARFGRKKEIKAVLLITQEYDFVRKCVSNLKSKSQSKIPRSQTYYKMVVVLSMKVGELMCRETDQFPYCCAVSKH